jgi:hypothetical protein
MGALLQRSADRSEVGFELCAHALNCADYCERDTSGDKAVFNGGCARLVNQKSLNGFHYATVERFLKESLNPAT